jgi:hypothetical protein
MLNFIYVFSNKKIQIIYWKIRYIDIIHNILIVFTVFIYKFNFFLLDFFLMLSSFIIMSFIVSDLSNIWKVKFRNEFNLILLENFSFLSILKLVLKYLTLSIYPIFKLLLTFILFFGSSCELLRVLSNDQISILRLPFGIYKYGWSNTTWFGDAK